ncbi:MAG TPA: ureidoglycolate lyase [Steroidobacteraceae bacterium]|nr:ureidoglycolate lyase [Steroidobacteraceae bacterium]HRX89011.1 ureidoglycolate lyase [Steroidobacteraceae bacterium]
MSENDGIRRIQLPLRDPTPAALQPYGVRVGADATAPRHSAFYGESVELWSPGRFRSDSDTCLSVARVHPRQNEVTWMERHFKHTQAFIPMGGAPFVVVLGAPTDTNVPHPDSVRAFHFDGSCGLLLHIGTWHEFPFATTQAVDMVVVLRNETNRDLEVRENDEAIGGDLEKRNVRARLGLTFAF